MGSRDCAPGVKDRRDHHRDTVADRAAMVNRWGNLPPSMIYRGSTVRATGLTTKECPFSSISEQGATLFEPNPTAGESQGSVYSLVYGLHPAPLEVLPWMWDRGCEGRGAGKMSERRLLVLINRSIGNGVRARLRASSSIRACTPQAPCEVDSPGPSTTGSSRSGFIFPRWHHGRNSATRFSRRKR